MSITGSNVATAWLPKPEGFIATFIGISQLIPGPNQAGGGIIGEPCLFRSVGSSLKVYIRLIVAYYTKKNTTIVAMLATEYLRYFARFFLRLVFTTNQDVGNRLVEQSNW